MSKPKNTQIHCRNHIRSWRRFLKRPARGQALVEYALITVLIVMSVMVAMLAAGPAIGNIFSNTVFNLLGAPAPSSTPLNPTEFWELVTAVASYTPQSVILPTNTLAPPTNTPTVGPSPTHTPETPTATPTATQTPGPSPTPEDVIHDAPFYDDISTANWWRLDVGSVFSGSDPWDIEWYATSTRTISAVESVMSGAPTCTSSSTSADINFFWGGSSGPAPGATGCPGNPWRIDDFASRWTRDVRFENDTTLDLTTISDDGIRVFIDGTLVPGLGDWGYHGDIVDTVSHTFTGGTDHEVIVEHFEGGGGATMVFNMKGASDDVGTCNWTMSGESTHSAPTAWNDSPNTNYSDNSTCHIALRGAVNLATLTEPPRMTFWERYDLDNFDKAWLQIREYGDTGPWFGQIIHKNYSEQLSWWRVELDLAAYDYHDAAGAVVGTVDWTGKTIEFRFVLEADASDTESGWWIDDIAIENNILAVYTIGFWDDMESGDDNWLPGGTWTISGEYTRSGGGAWNDSPGGYYVDWTNAILQLNGVVDLTVPESVTPEIVFYHSWELGTNDKIYLEASTDGQNWISLTESRPFEALHSETRNDVFVREAISLAAWDDKVFFLRFRLVADNDTERDGWYIDDITIQNHPTGNLPYPFFDNTESGASNWLPDGTWSLHPEEAYSGSTAWSDSPGQNYIHGSNSSLQTVLPFLLTTSIATNPELSFWHMRDLDDGDDIYVEVSTDDGSTWTPIWAYQQGGIYGVAPSTYTETSPGQASNQFDNQLAWEYVSVNIASLISDTVPFLLRFRLDALTDPDTDNGWWIDDIRLAEHVESPHSVPFTDDMEGTGNWRLGGDWEVHNENAHSGTYALSDSPGRDYYGNTWSVVQLKEPINLAGITAADFPILYWWEAFNVDRGDFSRVQISRWTGPAWSTWTAWQEVYQQNWTATESWDRRQIDLRPYAGQKIRLRFVMDALNYTNDNDPGWWIDDVSVELYDPQVIPLDFFDGAESLDRWITEGTWGFGSIFRGTGSGPAALGPGIWTARYFDLDQFGGVFNCGSYINDTAEDAIRGTTDSCGGYGTVTFAVTCEEATGDINYEWADLEGPGLDGACVGNPWNHDHFAIQWTRTITVEAGYYEFSIRHDDGARLYLDGSRIINSWGDTGPVTHTSARYLTTGTHTLDVWYYENSGGGVIQFDAARQSFSFTDSPGDDVDYRYLDNMSLILNGVIDMTGAVNPAMSWYDTFNVNDSSGACMYIEVMLPYETGQFDNWIELYRRCDARDDTWVLRTAPLRDDIESELGLTPGSLNFDGLLLTLRFRLDARITSDTDEGWWIDDIVLAD